MVFALASKGPKKQQRRTAIFSVGAILPLSIMYLRILRRRLLSWESSPDVLMLGFSGLDRSVGLSAGFSGHGHCGDKEWLT